MPSQSLWLYFYYIHHSEDCERTFFSSCAPERLRHLKAAFFCVLSSLNRISTLILFPSQNWQLQIRFVRLRDAGWYECAVSSHPSISLFVQLHVTESKAKIDGPPERYLKPGSMLRLTCRILDNIEMPLFIFWYHNARMVNYDSHLGINVTVQLGELWVEV